MQLLKQYQAVKDSFREYFIRYLMGDDFEENDLHDNDTYWIGDGSILAMNEYYVNLEDIKDIIEHSIPFDTFNDWYWDNVEMEWKTANLVNYFKIRWQWTHEDFLKLQERQEKMRNSPEFKEKLEQQLAQMKEDFIKNIS